MTTCCFNLSKTSGSTQDAKNEAFVILSSSLDSWIVSSVFDSLLMFSSRSAEAADDGSAINAFASSSAKASMLLSAVSLFSSVETSFR
jgi:hypothetical protein